MKKILTTVIIFLMVVPLVGAGKTSDKDKKGIETLLLRIGLDYFISSYSANINSLRSDTITFEQYQGFRMDANRLYLSIKNLYIKGFGEKSLTLEENIKFANIYFTAGLKFDEELYDYSLNYLVKTVELIVDLAKGKEEHIQILADNLNTLFNSSTVNLLNKVIISYNREQKRKEKLKN